jgi:hypothetical protein
LCHFKWKPTSNGIDYAQISQFGVKQVVNHVEGHRALTTKDELFLNLKAHCEKNGANVFEYLPLTFKLDFGQDATYAVELTEICRVINLIEKFKTSTCSEINEELRKSGKPGVKTVAQINECEHAQKNMWLLKPTGCNRGVGIHIFSSTEELQSILWNQYKLLALEGIDQTFNL